MKNNVGIKVLLLLSIFSILIISIGPSQNYETRAIWHTRWYATTEAEIQACVDYMVTHNMNVMYLQVYGDGYALYNSSFVPHSYLVAPDFDALAAGISIAHSAGIEVHAYINCLNVYSGGLPNPTEPEHVINSHPEWAMVDNTGWSMINNLGQSGKVVFYTACGTGFPQYVHDVAVEIATNYNVDGIHMDYIRYAGTQYDYCQDCQDDYYGIYGKTPVDGDSDWTKFRYDQITDLVDWIYTDVHSVNLLCQVSASTWNSSGNYFQDAIGMLEAGILDAACPMTYTADMNLFNNWITAYHQNSGGRNVYPGLYAESDKIEEQVLSCRNIGLEGQTIFAYSSLDSKDTTDINTVYTSPATPFPMPWIDGSSDIWPPTLSGIGALSILDNSAKIKWHSDEKGDSLVEYGETTSYGNSQYNSTLVYDHEIQLSDLLPDTTYHYRVTSADQASNSTVSADYTFTTTLGGVTEVIIDNDDDEPYYTETGTWATSGSSGYNGGTYRYAWGGDPSTATWTGTVSYEAEYDVYTMFLQSTNRCTATKFIVHASDGDHTVFIDQYGSTIEVVEKYIGRFSFVAGDNSVTIDALGSTPTGSAVIADAIRFTMFSATPTPTPTPTPTSTPTPGPRDDVATGETNLAGAVSGSYIDTQTQNDISETITEIESGGAPPRRYTYLEHTWNIHVWNTGPATFYVDAYRTGSGPDNFDFYYDNGSGFVYMLTVTKTADNDAYQSFELPYGTTGDVTIKVLDNNQTEGERTADSIHVDHIYIHSDSGGPTPTPTPTATTTPTPTPTATPSGKVYVNDIAMSWGKVGVNYYGLATVWIKYDSGGDAQGATVYGEWTGAAPGTSVGITESDGKVTLRSSNKKGGGTFNFCVTDVVASGYAYDPAMNVETCDSVIAP